MGHKSAERPCGTPPAVFAAGTKENVRDGMRPAMHRHRLARVKDTHALRGWRRDANAKGPSQRRCTHDHGLRKKRKEKIGGQTKVREITTVVCEAKKKRRPHLRKHLVV